MILRKQYRDVNIAKGLLMALVIVGHGILNSKLNETIVGFHFMKALGVFNMPAFFLISGMLIDKAKYRGMTFDRFIKEKIRRILIPYFFFETIGGLIHVITAQQTVFVSAVKVFSLECNIGADWYLATYFFAVIIYYFYVRIGNRPIGIALVVLIVAGRTIIPSEYASTRLGIDFFRILIGFSLLILGDMMRKTLHRKHKKWQLITFIVVVAICAKINTVDLWSAKIGNPALFLIGALSGTELLLEIARLLNSKSMEWIGKNTIPVLGTHQVLLNIMYRTYNWWNNPIIYFVVSLFVVCVAEIVIVNILNSYFPGMVGAKK